VPISHYTEPPGTLPDRSVNGGVDFHPGRGHDSPDGLGSVTSTHRRTGREGMAGDGRSVRRKGIAAVGVVVALIAGLVLTLGVLGRSGSGAQASGEVYLAPASATGPNPFTASLMTPGAAPALPPTPQPSEPPPPVASQEGAPPVAGNQQPPAAPATSDVAPTPAASLASVDGAVPQLYGGHMGQAPCDSHLLVRALDGSGDLARAWAEAVGVDVDGLHDFVGGLVAVVVLDDVRVTDWRHEDGRGVPYQVVLERGTAVLVDDHGEPRVRCISGDPLGFPAKVQAAAHFVGEHWEHFEPAALVVIAPAAKVLPTLVLLETSTGQPFGRPIGGADRADIDTQTLVADQARLGVVVSIAAPSAPDEVQELRLSPAGGPPGSIVLAFGTGWPAGDRIRIEPCVGSRPETCALRPDLAVFVVAEPDASDGGFKATLHVPSDARPGDYVEFYAQDLRGDHHERVFDAPWRIAASECRDSCGDDPGCHPPFCGGDNDHRGCRCMVRDEPVCQLDSCGQKCPKDRCVDTLAVTPSPTARPASHPTSGPTHGGVGPGGGGSTSSSGGIHQTTSQAGQGTANAQTSSHTTSQTQSGQSTSATHTQTSTQTSRSSTQQSSALSTHSQTTSSPPPTSKPTAQPTATSKPAPTAPPPPPPTRTPQPTPPPTQKPAPTATPSPPPTHTPQPTATPTQKPAPTAQPTQKPQPTAQPTQKPQATAQPSAHPGPSGR
jgi:hypothetical protein